MARGAAVMAAGGPGPARSAPEAAPSAEAPLQYSLLLQHLVGDQRQPRLLEPGRLGGIPSPAKSEEQKLVERAMESCAFKAALACVGGEARRGEGPGLDLDLGFGQARRPRACDSGDLGLPTSSAEPRGPPRLACALQSIGRCLGGCGGLQGRSWGDSGVFTPRATCK